MLDSRTLVRNIVAQSLGISADPAADAQDIFTELNGDDLDRLEIVMDIEQAFDLDLTDAQIETCRSVADFDALVQKTTGAADVMA